jgi:hypothetical protein
MVGLSGALHRMNAGRLEQASKRPTTCCSLSAAQRLRLLVAERRPARTVLPGPLCYPIQTCLNLRRVVHGVAWLAKVRRSDA